MHLNQDRGLVGVFAKFAWFVIPLFPWYFCWQLLRSWSASQESFGITLVAVAVSQAIGPVFGAGIIGGIHLKQQAPGMGTALCFIRGIREHYWRLLAAELLFTLAQLLILACATAVTGLQQAEAPILTLLGSALAAVSLFWYATIVVEHKVLASLPRALKALIIDPVALPIALAWAALVYADTRLLDPISQPDAYALHAARAAVFAVAKVMLIPFVLEVCKRRRGSPVPAPVSAPLPVDTTQAASSAGLTRTGFVLSFFSFVPLVHIIPLVLGVISIRRTRQIGAMSAVAIGLGGLFTAFYLLLLMGWFTTATAAKLAPGFAFLAEANPSLTVEVALLEQGSWDEAFERTRQLTPEGSDRDWTLECLAAITKYGVDDIPGALVDFRAASAKRATGGGCYYYYGLALIDDMQLDAAAHQFKEAIKRTPGLEAAKQQLALIEGATDPTALSHSAMLVVILIFLVTVHEYAHARAAWKLGDPTAREQGRLTLNPIPHLSLVGSILLPGLLLWQNSPVLVGWAKPVPVNAQNFKDPAKDEMRVSFAGPAVNALIAIVCFILLGMLMLFVRWLWPGTVALNLVSPSAPTSLLGPPFAAQLVYLVVFLKEVMYMSVILGVFNLIPIPPLDGSWILSGMLPPRLRTLYEKLRPFGFALLLLLLITPWIDQVLGVPLAFVWVGLQWLAWVMGLS